MAGRSLKFIVDAMLGNLVSWLRILGYDSLYWSGDDEELLQAARAENRIILTMDRSLASTALRSGVETFLLTQNHTARVLAQLSKRYSLNLDFDPRHTRCPHCNHLLKLVKEKPRREWICPGCGKRYWIGGHWRNIVKVLEEARVKVAEA